MIQAWLLFPVLLGLLSLGWGLGLERLSGRRLPGELLLPAGFAALLVVARLLAATEPTVKLATPVVVLVAVAGALLRRSDRVPRQVQGAIAAAALGVFVVFAAPVVLSGSATFAGYGVLGDTAVQFVLTDALMDHAGDVSGEGLSAFKQTVLDYKAASYPLGTHAALGAVRPLSGTDVAWVYQPYLGFLVSMLALTLAALLRGLVATPRRRALFAFLGAQPALVYAFAMQGSIKELATLSLVPLVVALAMDLVEGTEMRLAPRRLLPLLAAAAAAVAAIGPASVVWLGPILLCAVLLLARRLAFRPRLLALPVVVFVLALGLLSIPTLGPLADSVDTQGTVLTKQDEVGNLIHPLPLSRTVGVWLSGDYRTGPGSGLPYALTVLLIVLALAAAAVGLWRLLSEHRTGLLVYVGASLLALAVVTLTGSPWADAKGLAITAPAVLLLALIGADAVARRRRVPGLVLVGALGLGVLASNALIYNYASLAPRDRLEELGHVGDVLDGKGPTLSVEFEEYTKHFARDARPVGATELSTFGLQPERRPGVKFFFGRPIDLDALTLASVEKFPAVIVRRSPVASRPPADYRRVWSGRYYEAWRRAGPDRVREHLPLGSALNAAGVAPCAEVRRLAAEARASGGALVASRVPPRPVLATALRPLPGGWRLRYPVGILGTVGAGVVRGPITVTLPGSQTVWIQGSFGREVTVRVDGKEIGRVGDELAQPANWIALGDVDLRAGRHQLEISRGGRTPAPQSGDSGRTLGSVALTPAAERARLQRVPPARYRELCDRPADWIEVVSP